MNAMPKQLHHNSADGSLECKDESLDDMLTEQRIQLEMKGAIKAKKVVGADGKHDSEPNLPQNII